MCRSDAADDIVLIAETEEEFKKMMRRLKRYLEKKELVLNAEKSKVIVFEKGKMKKGRWKWGEDELVEIKGIKYLEYTAKKWRAGKTFKRKF